MFWQVGCVFVCVKALSLTGTLWRCSVVFCFLCVDVFCFFGRLDDVCSQPLPTDKRYLERLHVAFTRRRGEDMDVTEKAGSRDAVSTVFVRLFVCWFICLHVCLFLFVYSYVFCLSVLRLDVAFTRRRVEGMDVTEISGSRDVLNAICLSYVYVRTHERLSSGYLTVI